MFYPLGSAVAFYIKSTDEWLVGEVVDHLTFNGKVRHGVRVGARTYDVWPDISIAPAAHSGMAV